MKITYFKYTIVIVYLILYNVYDLLSAFMDLHVHVCTVYASTTNYRLDKVLLRIIVLRLIFYNNKIIYCSEITFFQYTICINCYMII